MEKNYIKWIRSKVGHDKIFLNFVGGCIDETNAETLELKYFSVDNFPELVNKQHSDVYRDICQNKYGVIR